MKLSKRKVIFLVLLLLVGGSIVIWSIAQSTDKRMRTELLQQARIAAQAISVDSISSLSASEKDLETIAYQRIKSQLTSMRFARHKAKFLYLMGRSLDGNIYFFVDSLEPTSENYASPGLIYNEAPESYMSVFNDKIEAVAGPVTDRWGTLVTALIPIISPDSGHLLAVLGMDIEADAWNREIIKRCIGPSLVVLLMLLLIFLLTSRENILLELKNNEKKLRNIVENATNLFYSHTVNHELTYISPRCRDFLQCEPEEAMIKWNEFASDNPINTIGFELTQKAIDTGECQSPYELELVGKKGEKIRVEVNETPVFSNNKVVGIVGALTDITERKRAEEKLQASESKYKSLFSSTNDGICLHEIVYKENVPVNYKILDVNPKFEQIIGIARDDAIGLFASDLYKTDEAPYLDIYAHVADTGTPTSFETYFSPMDKHFLVSVFSPTAHQCATAFQDITERKQAEEHRDKLFAELEKALSEIKILRGILPICSYCKKIRDDKGYWNQIESYIHKHSDAEFSHSICQDCAKKHYPEFDIYDKGKTQG